MMSSFDNDSLAESLLRLTRPPEFRFVGTPDGTVFPFAGSKVFCGVCGSNQEPLVDEVVTRVRTTGRFEVKGLWPFWRRFEQHLCGSCKAAMSLVSDRRAAVRRLLERAIALDPGNEVARSNLDTLRKMST
jgi:hypothetical protein